MDAPQSPGQFKLLPFLQPLLSFQQSTHRKNPHQLPHFLDIQLNIMIYDV